MSDDTPDDLFDPAKFLCEAGLYRPMKFTPFLVPDTRYPVNSTRLTRGDFFYQVTQCKEALDLYCPECDRDSTFCRDPSDVLPFESYSDIYNNELFKLRFVCSRHAQHVLYFVIHVHKDSFQKIGQWPSLADLASSDLKDYRKVLSKDQFSELKLAVELQTHGIGVGSFVYLRRIFEALVKAARERDKCNSSVSDEDFFNMRMKEQVKALSDELSEFGVEHPQLYSLLSLGLHALSETECRQQFPLLLGAIKCMLDEQLAAQVKQLRKEEISKALNAQHSSSNRSSTQKSES